MEEVPPGVSLGVDNVSVEVIAAAPLTANVTGLREQVGAGVPTLLMLHARVTLPV
jgi:hypothetical protein